MASLHILSLNVWSHYLVRAPHRLTRLEKMLEWIIEQHYDVVCLQELFLLRVAFYTQATELNYVVQRLSEAGFVHHTSPQHSLPTFFGQNSGLLILSKLPITQESFGVYQHGSPTEYCNNKGFITATISLAEQQLCLCTTHLDAHSDVRLQQVAQLTQTLQQQAYDTHTPLVVVGDMNICPRSTPALYHSLVEHFGSIGLRDLVEENEKTHIYGATLDHIFISEALSSQDIVCEYLEDPECGMLSDHYAVSTVVSYKAKAEK